MYGFHSIFNKFKTFVSTEGHVDDYSFKLNMSITLNKVRISSSLNSCVYVIKKSNIKLNEASLQQNYHKAFKLHILWPKNKMVKLKKFLLLKHKFLPDTFRFNNYQNSTQVGVCVQHFAVYCREFIVIFVVNAALWQPCGSFDY